MLFLMESNITGIFLTNITAAFPYIERGRLLYAKKMHRD
jgi:hypothetical protein